MCVCHCQILGIRCYRKCQPRQDEESRDIQPVDDLTVEPTTKRDANATKKIRRKVFPIRKKARYFGFNDCPSKNLTHALQDDDQFFYRGSPILLGLMQSTDV